jgi:anthranilate phosphoribosyltransferase
VPADLPADAVARSIETIGIGYLRQARFAPDMARLASLRDELALRTPLNMVEKIYDPAGAPYHIAGLTHLPYLDKLGDALGRLGFRKTALVQGMEGNEDLPTNRGVRVIEFAGDEKREYRVDATEFGLTPATNDDIAPGDAVDGRPSPHRSSELAAQVLAGAAPDAWRDLVLFNAGFRIYLAGRAPDIASGIERARDAITSGSAAALLDRWCATSEG